MPVTPRVMRSRSGCAGWIGCAGCVGCAEGPAEVGIDCADCADGAGCVGLCALGAELGEFKARFLHSRGDLLGGESGAGDPNRAGCVVGLDVGDAGDLADFLADGHFAVSAGHARDCVGGGGLRCVGGGFSVVVAGRVAHICSVKVSGSVFSMTHVIPLGGIRQV